jgi:hypothetical protein
MDTSEIAQFFYNRIPQLLIIGFGISVFLAIYSILHIVLPKPKQFTFTKETSKDLLSKLLQNVIKPIVLLLDLGPFKTLKKSVESMSAQRIEELLKLAGHPFGLKVADIQTFSGIASILTALTILIIFNFQAAYIPYSLLAVIFVYTAPIGILWIIANLHQNKLFADLENFLEALQVYLEGRYNLYDAISISTRSTTILKPHFEKCLREWPQGEIKALQNLAYAIGTPEMTLIVARLKQAVHYSTEELSDYISREAAQLDKLKEERGKQFQKIKPMIYFMYLGLPALSAFFIGIWPWAYAIQNKLSGM